MRSLMHILLLTLFAAGLIAGQPVADQQPARADITGGAALIFKRPQNPETSTQKRSGADNDKVEDAIALGNIARDRTPPDFESAERAYRLAWKLNPRDPRPYVGLGNIYWDQRRYPEAANWYRDALRYVSGFRLGSLVGRIPSGRGNTDTVASSSLGTQVRAYIGGTLLQEQRFMSAERELKHAIMSEPRHADWNAMLGYALTSQGRFTEAADLYEKAVRFEPANEKYKELLQQTTLKAREASAKDQAITSQLENTNWATAAGTCELSANGTVRCTKTSDTFGSSDARWKVVDGLFELRGVMVSVPFCVGQLREKTIEMKCGVEVEKTQRWTKVTKD